MIELIYTFTKKLSTDNKLEEIVNIYKHSYNLNSSYHKVILYTDDESKYLFEKVFKDIIIEDTSDVYFYDDLKYKVLPKLKANQLLTDGDIWLSDMIEFEYNSPILCDVTMKTLGRKYYKEIPKILIDRGIKKIIPYFNSNIEPIPNIGFIKFKSKKMESNYLTDYYKLRSFVIDNCLDLENTYGKLNLSAVIAQYLLGCFNTNIQSLRYDNRYVHYSGDEKYKQSFMKRFESKKLI